MRVIKIILHPLVLLKLVIIVLLVVSFWMLESVLLIFHYVLDTPLRWALDKIEKLIKLLLKQIK
jgi:hypothetical protein